MLETENDSYNDYNNNDNKNIYLKFNNNIIPYEQEKKIIKSVKILNFK